jgi:coenzyme F420-0:L-glutamate ligase / coenzyme F420-1:gamma-L-glutamate ligase
MRHASRLEMFAPAGFPLIQPGADLADMILSVLNDNDERLLPGDIVVVAQKIVSKSEDRYVRLADVVPSEAAVTLALEVSKDPRLVQLILNESRAVLRRRPGAVIVEHRLGFVVANAGIDASNVVADNHDQFVLLLPQDPDRSAAHMRGRFEKSCGGTIGVIINDSIGRAWRNGAVGTCLGSAGLPAHHDLRGTFDLFGRPLQVSTMGLSDELASAASLLQGQGNEGRPVVVARGYQWKVSEQTAKDLIRPIDEDMFR